jgi:hypothetical protein
MTAISHPPYISQFPRFKIKLKGRHFNANEAESQAVLNTATKHDLHDAFKKLQKRWEWCIRVEGDYFKDDAQS